MSDIFPGIYIGSENNNIGITVFTSGIIRIRPDLTIYDTIDKWKEYIAVSDSYCLYPIETKIESIELPKISLTSGAVTITIDTVTPPTNVELFYQYN